MPQEHVGEHGVVSTEPVAALAVMIGAASCVGPTPELQTVTLPYEEYEGGKAIRTPRKLSRCVAGGTRGDDDLGGRQATFPGDQRVVRFTGGPGADRGLAPTRCGACPARPPAAAGGHPRARRC